MSVRQDEMVFNMVSTYIDKAFGLVEKAIQAEVELTKALAAEGGCSEQFLELRSVEAREAREALAQFGSELKELGLAAERCYSGTLEHKLEMRKLELQHQLELRKLELSAPPNPPKSDKELDIELVKAKTDAVIAAPWDLREEVTASVFGVEPKTGSSKIENGLNGVNHA